MEDVRRTVATAAARAYLAVLAQRRIVEISERARLTARAHFDFANARPGNTFDAHRLLAWAADKGKQEALTERLFRASFVNGEAVGDRQTLAELAGEVGLDAEAARALLDGNEYVDEVRGDERQAARLGIRGVPFFVVGERYALSGAQPPATLRAAIERAWSEAGAGTAAEASGPACDADGCD